MGFFENELPQTENPPNTNILITTIIETPPVEYLVLDASGNFGIGTVSGDTVRELPHSEVTSSNDQDMGLDITVNTSSDKVTLVGQNR